MSEQAREVAAGERYDFGRNWARFLRVLDDDRIAEAERGLRDMLDVEDLRGLRFLDVGSGSGLHSLAARRLGARVRSFDYDPRSVACTAELRRRYLPDDEGWSVEEGSALDRAFMERLGRFDVVYSWGVLHHTGDMWRALENAMVPVAEGGRLFVALYNDQGLRSRLWRAVKRAYCASLLLRVPIICIFFPYFFLGGLVMDLLRGRNPARRYRRTRGMSAVTDWLDWLGGHPFEVAAPEAVTAFCAERGFALERARTVGRKLGCNELVYRRRPSADEPR